MFINNIYRDDNYYIEKNDGKITKFHSAESEGYVTAENGGRAYIFYEDFLGNVIMLTIYGNDLSKEYLLISKQKKNINRTIKPHFRGDELVLLFSSSYKRMTLINIYTERNGLCVFDICDSKNFISLKKKNDDILVVYRKGISLGYSTITGDSYSNYRLINSETPVSAYEFDDSVYVLCREDRYILVDLKNKIKHFLPLVFGIKPIISYHNKIILITYLKGRRVINYIVSDNVIMFHSERMDW